MKVFGGMKEIIITVWINVIKYTFMKTGQTLTLVSLGKTCRLVIDLQQEVSGIARLELLIYEVSTFKS